MTACHGVETAGVDGSSHRGLLRGRKGQGALARARAPVTCRCEGWARLVMVLRTRWALFRKWTRLLRPMFYAYAIAKGILARVGRVRHVRSTGRHDRVPPLRFFVAFR